MKKKIEWKKVTWYSQVLAIVLFVGVFALGLFFGMKFGLNIQKQEEVATMQVPPQEEESFQESTPLNTEERSGENKNPVSPLERRCDNGQCLFQGYEAVIGFAELRGFYTEMTTPYFNNTEQTCGYLVVEDAPEPLIKDLRSTVENGNTINTITENGDLAVKLNTGGLTGSEQAMLESATQDSPVFLETVRALPRGTEAGRCEGFLDVLSVGEADNV